MFLDPVILVNCFWAGFPKVLWYPIQTTKEEV